MKHYFPAQNQSFRYLQTNRSDRLGSLLGSFNLDFQKKYLTMMLSRKIVSNTTSDDDSDLGLPVAFEFWYNTWWAICGTRIFNNSSSEITAGFTEQTGIPYEITVGDSTTRFDITNPSGTTFRYTFDFTGTNPQVGGIPIGATVTIAGTDFNAANQGVFTVTGVGTFYFEVTNAGGLAESNKLINAGSIVFSGSILGQAFSSGSDMLVFNDRLWVTNNTNLYSNVANTGSQPWISRDIFSSSIIPHKLCYFKRHDRLYYFASSTSIRSIDTNDTVASGGDDYSLTPGGSIGYLSTMVANNSYIWIASLRDNSITDANSGSNYATISAWDGFSPQVTNEFPLESGAVLSMVVLNDVPYAIDSDGRLLKYSGYGFNEVARLPIGDNLLKDATTTGVARFVHYNGMIATKDSTIKILVNGKNEDGSVNEFLPSGIWEYDPVTNNFTHTASITLKSRASSTVSDYGQSTVSAVGALKLNTLESASSNGRSTMLVGATIFTNASSTRSGIFIDSPLHPATDTEGQKRGYFVTSWFESPDIVNNWVKVFTTYKRFLNSSDKIILKYRLHEEDPVYADIEWTTTTTFNTTTDVSDYAPTETPFDGTHGGEVEVLQGTGSGSCTHITSVTENAGVYEVTLDTAISNATGTGKVRFQKWVKLLPEITGQVLQYGQSPIAKADTRIQIKGVLEFTGNNEFHKMVVLSKPNINSDI